MNYDFSAPHLASAARLAIAFRFLGESILALALPPMRPPRRPNRTAAAFFPSGMVGVLVGLSDVAASTMLAAIRLISLVVLERLCMLGT